MVPVSISNSEFSGVSYGAETPVNSGISPRQPVEHLLKDMDPDKRKGGEGYDIQHVRFWFLADSFRIGIIRPLYPQKQTFLQI